MAQSAGLVNLLDVVRNIIIVKKKERRMDKLEYIPGHRKTTYGASCNPVTTLLIKEAWGTHSS